MHPTYAKILEVQNKIRGFDVWEINPETCDEIPAKIMYIDETFEVILANDINSKLPREYMYIALLKKNGIFYYAHADLVEGESNRANYGQIGIFKNRTLKEIYGGAHWFCRELRENCPIIIGGFEV